MGILSRPLAPFDAAQLLAVLSIAEGRSDSDLDLLRNMVGDAHAAHEEMYRAVGEVIVYSGWAIVPESGLGLVYNLLAMLLGKGHERDEDDLQTTAW